MARSASAAHIGELFGSLPPELQSKILGMVDSTTHLQALCLCSRQLRELAIEHLHADLDFTVATPDKVLSDYMRYCADQYAQYCKRLGLAFSVGPIINGAADLQRAQDFARILRACSHRLQTLKFSSAGSQLCDTWPTLEALTSLHFPKLTSLAVKIYDLDFGDVRLAAKFFHNLADGSSGGTHGAMKHTNLRQLSLEGYWSLASGVHDDLYTSPVFFALQTYVTSATSLVHLKLVHLNISSKDLGQLLSEAKALTTLSLIDLDDFSLEDCMLAILGTPTQGTLEKLNISISYALTPASVLQLTKAASGQRLVLSHLRQLSLSLKRYYPAAETSDLGVFCLYASLLRCKQLAFPALATLEMHDAWSYSTETSKVLASYLMLAKRFTMPRLGTVTCRSDITDNAFKAAQAILGKLKVQIIREDARTVDQNKVIFVNRGGVEDPDSLQELSALVAQTGKATVI